MGTALRQRAVGVARLCHRQQDGLPGGREERQACYNAEGVEGLLDHPKRHRRDWLTEAEPVTLQAVVFKGAKPEKRRRLHLDL